MSDPPSPEFDHDTKGDTPQSVQMNYDQALDFLYQRIDYERMAAGAPTYRFRLQRIRVLLERLRLQDYLYAATEAPAGTLESDETPIPSPPPIPLIHIAGTKGKGSTATMVANCLSAAGYKTGLYTSPHLHRIEERFCVDMQPCQGEDLCGLINQVALVAQEMANEPVGAPSFFELTTAIAILHFHQSDCDAMVIEVGLGGRLDSTNVLSTSVCAITTIGLDHQNILGDTLAEIATEKAGIIKPGVPIICGVIDSVPANVIAEMASKRGAPLFRRGRDFHVESEISPDWGSIAYYQGTVAATPRNVRAEISLEGNHQAGNAATAIAILDALGTQGLSISDGAIRTGLACLPDACRIERFDLGDDIGIIDAAHNRDSIAAMCDCLRSRMDRHQIIVIFGTSQDKDAEIMLKQIAEVADVLLLTQYQGNPRFEDAAGLLPLVPESIRPQTRVVPLPTDACQIAHTGLPADPAGRPRAIVCCGSFFLAAETRPWMVQAQEDAAM